MPCVALLAVHRSILSLNMQVIPSKDAKRGRTMAPEPPSPEPPQSIERSKLAQILALHTRVLFASKPESAHRPSKDAGSGGLALPLHFHPLLPSSLSVCLPQMAIQISMMTTSMPLPSPPSYLKVHMPSFFSSQYAPVALCIPRRPTCGLPSVAVASVLVDT